MPKKVRASLATKYRRGGPILKSTENLSTAGLVHCFLHLHLALIDTLFSKA